MSLYILLNSALYVLFWNVMMLIHYGKYSISMAAVSFAVALAPAMLIGAFSDDGKIENFLRRPLKHTGKEKGFISFCAISALPLSLLTVYMGIKEQPNFGTLVGGISLLANAIFIAMTQFFLSMKSSKGGSIQDEHTK